MIGGSSFIGHLRDWYCDLRYRASRSRGRSGRRIDPGLVERQIQHVLAVALVDHLARGGQDALHGFQIQALARDFRRRAVLRIDQAETLRIAGRRRDVRGLVALRLRQGCAPLRRARSAPPAQRRPCASLMNCCWLLPALLASSNASLTSGGGRIFWKLMSFTSKPML